MGVLVGITMTREMLTAGNDAAVAQTAHPSGAHFNDLLRSRAKCTITDDGIRRIRINVEHGCEIEIKPDYRQFQSSGAATLIYPFGISGASDLCSGRKTSKRLRQAMNAPALLIDCQEWRFIRCRVTEGSTQVRDLFGRPAVLLEENKTAEGVLFKN